ncbi:vegetative incompatibility protein HET-E-1 [Tricladium varicosporioides]|nr:vegetative incompatibility protein HET-E-1 [Hymenoscyphus varicosporioides]
MIEGNGASKTSFDKIRFCGEQARYDRLQYFWVDTYYIDKSSSAELTEAINSIFRWYQNTVKCYVYLSDISTKKRKASDSFTEYTWEPAFRSSKWFTRGWTLQELIAPTFVEFFSKDQELLGDKRRLEQQIHEITGIAISALRGIPLSQFNIEDRLSWAKDRRTTREEDKAYSLFGIFDIQIPLLYGEGGDKALKRLREEINKPLKDKAFRRLFEEGDISLKELDRLPSAAGAAFNSFDRQQDPTCLPDTRVDLLQEICDWADGEDGRCIFWLNGLAGTGKSTIARTIAQRYCKEERLGASFFFSRGGGDVSHAGKFFTSIAVQLANNIPSLRHCICDAISNRKDIASQSFRDQWSQLILFPLSKLGSGLSSSSYMFVIDALDECDKDEYIRMILQLLAEARTLNTARLRVFLTSRPEIPIRHGFYQMPDAEHQDFVLHNVPSMIINHDISLFLEYNLGTIKQEWSLRANWPGEAVLEQLVYKSSGLFIWAATACRFINEGEEFAEDRLDEILEGTSFEGTPEQYLDQIYLTVLQSSIPTTFRSPEKVRLYARQRRILGSIAILFSPLPAASLAKVISISRTQVTQTLERLQAILDVPKDITSLLRLHHPSFRDFLLNKDRCGEFWTLKKDICEMHAPGSQASQVENSWVEKCLLPEVQYTCLYWVQHLQRSGSQAYDNEEVHQFLQAHLLHWLEALGWMGKTSEGIQAILSLEAYILATESPNLHIFVHDIKRFALYNRLAIEQTPLQLYCSALVFAPEKSIVRETFEKCISTWIEGKSRAQTYWSAALQTLEGHSSSVNSVAFSPDGKQVVSGSGDRTVRLWDAATGAALQTLEGHSSSVNSVAFSPDGKQVVSGSGDRTVRLWDAATGAVLQTLEGHSSYVTSVAFSPDGKQVVSGSGDKTVRLWDTATGAALQTLEGHSYVTSVAFSPDGKQVVSGSGDRAVRLWDAATGAPLQTFEGHSYVSSVAFSPDGKQVALGSGNATVRLWDAATGKALQTLEGHSDWVNSVAFSPDGKQVVSGSGDNTVRLWDAATGAPLQTLEGHSSYVTSVAFSPDGKQVVSGSGDNTVRLWDTATGKALQTLKGHSSYVTSVAFSPDGKQVVSGSGDKTVRLWDAATGKALQTLKGHSGYVTSVAFSPDGKQVVSSSGDKTVRLWDTATGKALQTLEGHSSYVSSVAFSPDGKQVVSGSGDKTVRLWDTATGKALQTLEGHSSYVSSVAFSPDGNLLPTLRVSDYWVVEGEANILWLPPDYRSTCEAIWDQTIVLGHSSGRLSFLQFRQGLKLVVYN